MRSADAPGAEAAEADGASPHCAGYPVAGGGKGRVGEAGKPSGRIPWSWGAGAWEGARRLHPGEGGKGGAGADSGRARLHGLGHTQPFSRGTRRSAVAMATGWSGAGRGPSLGTNRMPFEGTLRDWCIPGLERGCVPASVHMWGTLGFALR